MARREILKLSHVRDHQEFTFIDNLTLFHARPYFHEVPVPGSVFTSSVINHLSQDPKKSAFLGLLEALVLCDRCLIDSFTLDASAACQEIVSLFPQICVALDIEGGERAKIYQRLAVFARDKKLKGLLADEQRLASQPYRTVRRQHRESSSTQPSFAELYYDPTDRFKHGAIARGLYDPLNTLRTHFYVDLAKDSGLPYLPHPWRGELLSKLTRDRFPTNLSVPKFMISSISAFREEIRKSIAGMEEAAAPAIAASILKRAREPKYVAEVVIDMRESRHARRFRRWCKEFREALSEGMPGTAKVQKMWRAVQEATEKWKYDLDEEVRYRTRSLKIGIGPASTDIAKFRDPILRVKGSYRPLLFLNDIFRW